MSARLILIYGHPAPFEWHDGGRTGSSQFAAMLLHIVGQQISAAAAFGIYDRISTMLGWSAETFLIHNLHRPDVLPAGDLGIRRAVQTQWRLEKLPPPGQVRSRASAWAPWRSYAAALLWRSLRPQGEASDPKERALIKLGAATKPGRMSRATAGLPHAPSEIGIDGRAA